jgi:LemA protein
MSVPTMVILGVVVLAVAWAIGAFNRLVALRNRFKNAFAQIDVQLKRRHDLIPNLVETARGYMKHERETLEAVVQARSRADAARQVAAGQPGGAEAMKGLAGAESGLSGILGRFFALMEAYPDLKANQTMSQLMEELSTTENRVAFSRQAFNDAVTAYNISRESFPNNLIAARFGFTPAALLEPIEAAEERKAPKVSF